MRLKSLHSIAFLFSLAVAQTVTPPNVQKVIDGIVGLNDRVASLQRGIVGALGPGGPTTVPSRLALALDLHSQAMNIMNTAEDITRTAKTCPELSDEQSSILFSACYQMQPMFDTTLTLAVEKKTAIDNVPRVTAMVGLGLIQMREALNDFQNALMDITPMDRLAEGHALATHVLSACDAAIIAFGGRS